MNLRQKAKHYKQLAEMYGARTVDVDTVCAEKIQDLRRFDDYQLMYNFQELVEKDVRNLLAERVKDYMELEWHDLEDGYATCRATLRVGRRRH